MAVDENGYVFSETDGSWTAPQEVLREEPVSLNSTPLSCASHNFCVLVSSDGKAYTYNGVAWSGPAGVNPGLGGSRQGRDLSAVSCPQVGYCVALGSSGYSGQEGDEESFTFSDGHWSGPVTVVPGTFAVFGMSVSCSSTTFCAATTPEGGMAIDHSGRWVRSGSSVNGAWVSCIQGDECMTASLFDSWVYRDGSWSGVTPLEFGNNQRWVGLSCSTGLACEAVRSDGEVASYSNGSWSSVSPADPNGALSSVSCGAPGVCTAIDSYGYAISLNVGAWTQPVPVDMTPLSLASCATSSLCVAINYSGIAFIYRNGYWSPGSVIEPDVTGLQILGLSCAAPAFCVAIDGNHAIVFNGTSWSPPATVNPSPGGVGDVSCVNSQFCMAIDDYGNAYRYDGKTWTSIHIDSKNPSLTDISCPTTAFCMVDDASGNTLEYVSGSWTKPLVTDPSGVYVSCASKSYCVALGGQGKFLTYNGTSWSKAASTGIAGGVESISCPQVGLCFGLGAPFSTPDTSGVVYYSSGSWQTTGYTSVGSYGFSCPTKTFCVSVSDTDAYTFVPTTPPVACPNVSFVSVHGSGDDPGAFTPTRSIYGGIEAIVGRSQTMSFYELPYAADSVSVLIQGINWHEKLSTSENKFFGDVATYLEGEKTGVTLLSSYVTSMIDTCSRLGKTAHFVLAGYSQGAMVISDYVDALGSNGATSALADIDAVALVANPERVSLADEINFGTAAQSDNGVCHYAISATSVSLCTAGNLTDLPAIIRSRTSTLCDTDDLVCDTTKPLSKAAAVLRAAASFPLTGAALTAIVTIFKDAMAVHGSYANSGVPGLMGRDIGQHLLHASA